MNDFLHGWNEKSGRIIVFAGVFDPIHSGHIAIAQEAERLYGESVVFMPERVPQHKHGATSYEHRMEMLRVATESDSDLAVLDYPGDHHWIVDTFKWLTKKFPDRKFAWLVGSDVAGSIEEWSGADRLHELNVNLIIIAKRAKIENEIQMHTGIAGLQTVYMKSEHMHLSSAYVRADPENRYDNLPEGVYEYIKKSKLYSSD